MDRRLALISLLLFSLYALQGLAFGLINGSLPVLLARQTSYTRLGQLSIANWPYALKALFAPLVDAFWSARVGRRKSWVLSCTLLSAAVFATLASSIDGLLLHGQIGQLTTGCFLAILCLAAQDVAVDAWAIELLPRRQLAFASVLQTLGMSAGNSATVGIEPTTCYPSYCLEVSFSLPCLTVIGHPVVLFLAASTWSPDSAGSEDSARSLEPSLPHPAHGGGPLQGVLSAFARGYLVVALATMFAPDSHDETERPSLIEVFQQMRKVIRAPETMRIGGICLLQRVGIAAVDGCAEVYYMHLDGARPGV